MISPGHHNAPVDSVEPTVPALESPAVGSFPSIAPADVHVSSGQPSSVAITCRTYTIAAAVPTSGPAGVLQHTRPLAVLELAQLMELFTLFDGAIPRRELVAEGFDVPDLVARGVLMPPQSHYDFDFYFVGETLRRAIQKR